MSQMTKTTPNAMASGTPQMLNNPASAAKYMCNPPDKSPRDGPVSTVSAAREWNLEDTSYWNNETFRTLAFG